MTGTVDRLFSLKSNPNRLVPVETKTTSWSLDKMYESVRDGDQVKVYWLGVAQRFPQAEVSYVYPEILYSKGNVARAGSPSAIDVTKRALARLQMNLIGSFARLHQSLVLLKEGLPPELIFPRNPNSYTEVSFGNEFASVQDLNPADWMKEDYMASIGWKIEDRWPKLNAFVEAWETTDDPEFLWKRS
jgi:hypothetical protein